MKESEPSGLLEAIRGRVRGWALWLFLAVVAAPFVFFGMGRYLQPNQGPDDFVARVDGTTIPAQTFQRRFQYAFAQVRQMLTEGGQRQLPNEAAFERAYKLDLLQSMVQERLMARAAVRMGLGVPDAILARTIRNVPVFQEQGQFSQERYRTALATLGEQTNAFEDDLRQQMLAAFVQQAITYGVVVADHDVDLWVSLRDEQRQVAVSTFAWRDALGQVSIDDAAIQEYFKAHMEDFQEPPRVRLAAVVITPEDAGAKPPTEEELQRYYQEHRQEFLVPEQRLVRHILLHGKDIGDIQKPLEQIRQQLRAGKPFAAVAKVFSEDAGTKSLGGELGWIQRGMLPPELEKVVFAVPVQQLSAPVKGPEGWHVFLVEESRGGTEQPFAAVKEAIAKKLMAKRNQEAMQTAQDQLADWVYTHGDDLEPLADRYGTTVKQSPWLSRATQPDDALWRDPAVLQVAFGNNAAVGRSSEPVVLADGHLAVVKIAERRPARVKALQEVKDEVRAALQQEKARELTRQQAMALKDQLAKASADSPLPKTMLPQWLARSSPQGLPSAIQQAAFGLGPPSPGHRAVTMTQLPSGDAAVIVVLQVKKGDPGKLSIEERSAAKETLRSQRSEQLLNAYLAYLTTTMRVEVNTDRL